MHSANQIAEVILERHAPWTDAMTLEKLLYYVQAWHLAITDQPIFPEPIKAWKDGPVVPGVWHARKDRSTRVARSRDTSDIDLNPTQSSLIDLVIQAYGSMSAEELSALTHTERPWLEARGDTPDGEPSSAALSVETMAKFYREHRTLDGRTAADLAAGGVVPLRAASGAERLNVSSLLASLGDEYNNVRDEWGGANLNNDLGADSPWRRGHAAPSF